MCGFSPPRIVHPSQEGLLTQAALSIRELGEHVRLLSAELGTPLVKELTAEDKEAIERLNTETARLKNEAVVRSQITTEVSLTIASSIHRWTTT